MATYDLEEQEQISELKTWWNQHGNLVVALLAAGAIAAVGYQGWNWYQRNQTAQASAVYSALQKAVSERDARKAREVTGELIDKYAGTTYAGLAALVSAKVQYETGDARTAKVQLAWAAENAKDQELRDLARLRLAAVLTEEKAYDDALKQLASEPLAPFAARYAESRGDVLAAQGKAADAKAAYEAALARLDGAEKNSVGRGSVGRERVRIKLEALGE